MYYFAYGTEMARKVMAQLCPNAKPKYVATLPNHKLIFMGYSRRWHGGMASIKAATGERVMGAVYEIGAADLRVLDKEAGYPALRDRVQKMVYLGAGEPIEATTYMAKRQTEETKPSPEYLAVLQQAYREWNVI